MAPGSDPSGGERGAGPGRDVQATRAGRVVALGGVGKDSHSVGLHVLRDALRRSGYRVRFLSTQNSVEDLCRAAQRADAILVSNMDGHARHYLQDLPTARAGQGGASAVWYLGGNPVLDGTEDDVAHFKALGFDRVILDYVSSDEVIKMLDVDLARPSSNLADEGWFNEGTATTVGPQSGGGDVASPLSRERPEVLAQWPTGRDAQDLAASGALLAGRCALGDVQARRAAGASPLLQPRCGVGDAATQLQLFQDLAAAGADVLSFQIDSLTRNNCHADVAAVLARASGGDGPQLNGFPAVNHGAAVLREIVGALPAVPFQVRHSTRDPRLLAEISFAGGVTAFEGGALCYNLPYYPDLSPAESVRRWRYVDELAGHFTQAHGVAIDREFFGVLTATLIPPSLAIAVCVLEALAAAARGVRSVSLGYAEQGHRWQDIAAIRSASILGRCYLDRYGWREVRVSTVFHQFMGAFPTDPEAARGLIHGSAVTAALSGATRIMLKTQVEATRIPSGAQNGAAIGLAQTAFAAAAGVLVDEAAVGAECDLIHQEASAILDRVLEAGGDDPDAAMVAGVAQGLIDVPFSPSRWVRGELRCVRDVEGAVRIARPGVLPIPPAAREENRAKVAGRLGGAEDGLEAAIEHDVTALINARGQAWPLWDRVSDAASPWRRAAPSA
jgi:methylaspartate mutase epsilon subunit